MADMKTPERSRIRLLAGVATLLVTTGGASPAWSQARPEATVYKSPT
jgi:hypothetical protein